MPLVCPGCENELPPEVLESPGWAICPACNRKVLARVFPAVLAQPQAVSAEAIPEGSTDAGCFFHPAKRAAALCSRCGRFLCSLCEVELQGETWCPECLSSGVEKKRIVNLESRRVLYDSMALFLGTWPILMGWVVFFTAPAAIFVAIRYWRAPSSLVRRGKWRNAAAILSALLQLGLFGFLVLWLFVLRYKRS